MTRSLPCGRLPTRGAPSVSPLHCRRSARLPSPCLKRSTRCQATGPRKKTRKALLPGHAGRTAEMVRAMAPQCEPEVPAIDTTSALPSIPESVGEMPAPSGMLQTKLLHWLRHTCRRLRMTQPRQFRSSRHRACFLSLVVPLRRVRWLGIQRWTCRYNCRRRKPCKPCKHQSLYPLSAFPFTAAPGPAAEPYVQVAPLEPPWPAPPPPPPPPPVIW